ncbi:MAG: hypothetical protein ACLFVS_00200 [Candidatus Acetothermia bacterium]
MKSVRQIKNILGLNTIHQARNRIKAIDDVLDSHIKRGENNEILVSDEGVSILTKLQDLYESGLLLSEAADVVRSDFSFEKDKGSSRGSYTSKQNQTKPEIKGEAVDFLLEEIEFQRELMAALIGKEDTVEKGEGDDKWWLEWI